MIKTAICKGKKVEIQNVAKIPGKGEFAWVYASNPSESELANICKLFNINKKVIQHYNHESRTKK